MKAKNDAIAAENNVKVLQADADAYAIGARGDALKRNPALIEMTIAEKWDGKLPQRMVPGGALPFVTLPKP